MSIKQKIKTRTPRQATTHDQICDLPRDNWTVGDYRMLLNEGHITIAHPKVHPGWHGHGGRRVGEPGEYMAQIPRRVWHAFIRAYETGSTRNRK